nr:11502_t:CDS:2 [Entrophospora candida]CAG8444340.1 2490_t:CDS:2 [Entrophospora candida]
MSDDYEGEKSDDKSRRYKCGCGTTLFSSSQPETRIKVNDFEDQV